ncbi:condensation domain-containing protein, partial [Streptomyces olivaceoviridis]
PLAVRLRGALDRAALEAALTDVIIRHESLRTVVTTVDGVPRQLVREAAGVSLSVPVSTVAEEALAPTARELADRPIDMGVDLPLRADLLQMGPEDHVLVLVVHHIAADGWSLAPLAADISTAYTARLAGRAPEWQPLPVQYADYTLWQRNLLGREDDPDSVLTHQLAYWRHTLADLPEELALPTDRPRPHTASYQGAGVHLTLPPQLHKRLLELAHAQGVTLHMVIQSALAVLLSRLGAGQDIPIGTPVAGRTDDALDDLVGFFVNTLVTRTDLSGDPTFSQLLSRVRDHSLEALAHQDIPFERLVEELCPTRSMARHPLFQVMLTLQNTRQAILDLPGLTIEPVDTGERPAKFDLSVDLAETFDAQGAPTGVHGTLTYATDLFDASTARVLAARFVRVLEGVVADPDRPLHRIEVMDTAERERVLT